jgi:uroporphyrinogen-III synthase
MSALAGRIIAVPESRELDVFAGLLERRGARVWRCPLINIVDAPDAAPVLAWLRLVGSGGCQDLVFLTGEGLRRLVSCAERHEPGLRASFLTAMAHCRIITRGPKPARALRELGLSPTVPAETPTTAGVIAALRTLDLGGHRVGVQLYGSEPNEVLIGYLRSAGATPAPVAPYEYVDAAADQAVHELIGELQARRIDAVAFTSKAQVERLFRVAGEAIAADALRQTLVAAVGPVVAAALQQRGVAVSAMPQASFFMKPMATELAALFSDTSDAGTP